MVSEPYSTESFVSSMALKMFSYRSEKSTSVTASCVPGASIA